MSKTTKKKKYKFKPNIPNIIFTLLSIALLFTLIFKYDYRIGADVIKDNDSQSSNNTSKNDTSKEVPKDIELSMTVVGDIMCHNTQYQDAYDKTSDTYDFSHVFTNVADELKNADITIGNLETTFAGKEKGYSGYPTFNTPEALATNLKDLGFDVLSTTNNHSLDSGYKGLVSTLETLDSVGIDHMGTYSSEEAQKEILIKDVKGIKIAFLAYTYGTNGIPVPKGKEYCINLIDKDLIKQDLDKAKAANVDLICVNMHWGNEYRLKTTQEQEDLADFLFQNGVDIILGSHPHVLEPMERRTITLEDGTTKDGFVIYSLGNFVSGQVKEYTNHSIILNLELTKHVQDNYISIDNVSYIPIYVDNRGSSAKERFKILNINKSIQAYEDKTDSSISSTLYNKLKNAHTATKEILEGK